VTLAALLSVFSIFFVLLNFVGGLVAIVWLALLGEWSTLGVGLLTIFVSTLLIGIALLPGMIFALPLVALAERGRPLLAAIAGLPALLWTYAVMGIWCLMAFAYFVPPWDPQLPYLLLAYEVATVPWSYMALRESQSGNSYSAMTAFFSQVGCAVLIGYHLFFESDPSFQQLTAVYSVPMIVCFVVQLLVMAAYVVAERAD
jgi:hypothetical protein